jgi:hypothetical protein
MVVARIEQLVDGEDRLGIAPRAQRERTDLQLLQAQVQQRVVQLAEGRQGPPRTACRVGLLGRPRTGLGRRSERHLGQAFIAADVDPHVLVVDAIVPEAGLQSRQLDAPTGGHRRRPPHQGGGCLLHRLVEAAQRCDLVDQVPLHGAPPLDALGNRAEDVGPVAAHLALVDEARQPPGAGQDAEQRQLGEGDGAAAIVDQQDVVGRQGELIATTTGGAVQRGQRLQAGVLAGLLQVEPRLVRELAEVHLEGVRRLPEHHDVGARAEDPLQGSREDQAAHLGMGEAQVLQRCRQLDVDAEVVAVQLEDVVVLQAAVLLDAHDQARDRPLHGQRPVDELVRADVEVEVLGHGFETSQGGQGLEAGRERSGLSPHTPGPARRALIASYFHGPGKWR